MTYMLCSELVLLRSASNPLFGDALISMVTRRQELPLLMYDSGLVGQVSRIWQPQSQSPPDRTSTAFVHHCFGDTANQLTSEEGRAILLWTL